MYAQWVTLWLKKELEGLRRRNEIIDSDYDGALARNSHPTIRNPGPIPLEYVPSSKSPFANIGSTSSTKPFEVVSRSRYRSTSRLIRRSWSVEMAVRARVNPVAFPASLLSVLSLVVQESTHLRVHVAFLSILNIPNQNLTRSQISKKKVVQTFNRRGEYGFLFG